MLETDRLLVRTLTIDDAEVFFALSQEPITKRELPEEVLPSLEKTRKRLRCIVHNYATGKYPQAFAVVLKQTGEIIGHIGLSPIEFFRVEIEYAIADRFQHNGYAAELVVPFTAFAKANFGLETLYGIAKSKNTASCKCLEKAGFKLKREGLSYCFGGFNVIRVYTA